MTKNLKAAVVGFGAMGQTHASAWDSIEGVDVIGVVSRSASTDQWPTFPDIAALLADTDPDIVSVCTPTDTHPVLVTQLLNAGCDVVVEKPIALDPEVAREMYAAAARTGRALFVGHVLRHFPEYEMIAHAVDQGVVGKVATVRLRRAVTYPQNGWFHDKERSGGVQFDLMIHDIDFVISFLGSPASVYASESQKAGVCVLQTVMTFEGGAIAQIEGIWGTTDGLDTRCEVAGELGNLFTSSETNAGIRITQNGAARFESPLVKDPYAQQLRAILRKRSGGKTGVDEQAIMAVEVCRAITRSIELGRAVTVAGKEE